MTNKELILAALKNQKTPRAPWLPFVGVHGGKMLGISATDYLKSADAIVEGLSKALDLYKPDALPISFDLQMEAELLGCQLHWAKDVPPSVTTHPYAGKSGDELKLPKLDLTQGRFTIVSEATKRMKAKVGDSIALYGLITGPFTLAMHLYGNDIFLEMFDEPEKIQDLIMQCAEIGKDVATFYIERGCDVVAVVDPMTSQISKAHFNEFFAPAANAVFDHIHAKGALASLFVCGDASRVLDAMCQTNCDNISVDENIPLENLRDITRKYGKSFGGNLKLTVALLLGSEADAKLDAIRCLDIGGTEGFICAPGCDLPYDVPEKNLIAVSEMIHDPYKRDIARTTLKATEHSFDDFIIPDYANEKNVIIDVITLDSTSCAPCQYMMLAAEKAAEEFGHHVTVREHKIKDRDGLGYLTKLKVSNLPTICIDGEAKFISIIPDQPTLVKAIEEKAAIKK